MAASRPTRKTRKFDVHAYFAGMNIKFPALLGRWHVPHHTPKCVLFHGKYQRTFLPYVIIGTATRFYFMEVSMLIKKRFTLFGLLVLTMTLILTACAIGQQPEPTPDAVDVDAIYTSAAETAMVQMTEIASIATPTLPPTATPTEEVQPDDTPLIQVTPLADDEEDETPIDSSQPVTATITPMPGLPTPAAPVVAGTPEPECNSVQWEGETIPDGTKFKAGQTFTKVWKLRNTGTCTWTDGYSFRLIDGNRMGGVDYYFIGKNNHIAPGEAVSMGVTMRAPNELGRHRGYWQLFSDQATNYMGFGWPVWVEIEVVK
jgi:hypothetical protein